MANEFYITMHTDNAAFEDGNGGAEIARILRAVADRIEQGATTGKLFDSNGNNVGLFDREDT